MPATSPMLSKPYARASSGSMSAAANGTPSRSCTVRPYSARDRRRRVAMRASLGTGVSAAIAAANSNRSPSVGCDAASGGGIVRERTRCRAVAMRACVLASGWAANSGAISKPSSASGPEWHLLQCRATSGGTRSGAWALGDPAASCAPSAHASISPGIECWSAMHGRCYRAWAARGGDRATSRVAMP